METDCIICVIGRRSKKHFPLVLLSFLRPHILSHTEQDLSRLYMCNRTEVEETFPTSTSVVSSASSCVSYRTGPVSFIYV